jgi:hypothetical protein
MKRGRPATHGVNLIEEPRDRSPAMGGRPERLAGAPRPADTPALHKENLVMKSTIVAAAAMLAAIGFSSGTASAADGCVKGAVIGGVVGHVAGHHGLLGAGAGCLIGRHESNRGTNRDWDRDQRDHNNSYGGDGSSYRYRDGSGYSR